MHVATEYHHDYTVECLVEGGADTNLKDDHGVSATIQLMVD